MWKAIAYKELRESLGVAGLALAAFLFVTMGTMRAQIIPLPPVSQLFVNDQVSIPFVSGGFYSHFMLISAALAIGLGLRQTIGESISGTYLLLLHRPLRREQLFMAKLAVGVGVYLLCAAIPVVLYMWWAATPGTHASPFYLSMTLPTWQLWISMPIVYLGAFLTGIRPGRWMGSRLAPLVSAAFLMALIQMLPWWWLIGLAASIAVAAYFVVSIVYVARVRDYS